MGVGQVDRSVPWLPSHDPQNHFFLFFIDYIVLLWWDDINLKYWNEGIKRNRPSVRPKNDRHRPLNKVAIGYLAGKSLGETVNRLAPIASLVVVVMTCSSADYLSIHLDVGAEPKSRKHFISQTCARETMASKSREKRRLTLERSVDVEIETVFALVLGQRLLDVKEIVSSSPRHQLERFSFIGQVCRETLRTSRTVSISHPSTRPRLRITRWTETVDANRWSRVWNTKENLDWSQLVWHRHDQTLYATVTGFHARAGRSFPSGKCPAHDN